MAETLRRSTEDKAKSRGTEAVETGQEGRASRCTTMIIDHSMIRLYFSRDIFTKLFLAIVPEKCESD